MGHRMLQLLLLQLDLLARRSNVHQSPPDLGDLIEHLLIGQIKHLVRLLGGIERLVGLGLHYRVGPLEKAHAALLLADDGPAAPIPLPGRLWIDAGADTGTDTPEATAEAAAVTWHPNWSRNVMDRRFRQSAEPPSWHGSESWGELQLRRTDQMI